MRTTFIRIGALLAAVVLHTQLAGAADAPPLRERLGDVEKLAEAFLIKFCPGATLSAGAVEALCRHNWPGNVRELRNVVERASIFIGGEREILPQHILL